MSFIITTTDNQFTYTALTSDGGAVIESWQIKNNNKASNTQGFLRKIEKGDIRVECVISLTDFKANLEANVLPMLTFPANVTVTFNRNIPGKITKTGIFTMEDYTIKREFNNGAEMEIDIKLVEVI